MVVTQPSIAIPTAALVKLCKEHYVCTLHLFGSAVTDKFNPESDLDFLVTFQGMDPEMYAEDFFNFRDALTALFGRDVDLIEEKTLKNPYFKAAVESHKVLLYG